MCLLGCTKLDICMYFCIICKKIIMLNFDRYALREYGVEFDEFTPDVESIDRLVESLKVKRVSDDVRKEIFDSLIFGGDNLEEISMDIAKMDNVPLLQCQQSLQNREVLTGGRFTYPEEVIDYIDLYGGKVEELIISLHSDSTQPFPFYDELKCFIEALQKSLKTIYRVLLQVDLPIELTDLELQDVLCNLQDMMAFVLSLQSKEVMRKSTFKKASKLTPYWSEEISYLLDDDNIAKELQNAGIDLGDLTVRDIFTKSRKLVLASQYTLDPLDAVKRVATHMSDTLSDENIAKELQNAGIDLGDLTVNDIFTKSRKLHFALYNMVDPLDAVKRVATHMSDTLSDENIAKELQNAGIDLGDLTVNDIFTKSTKLTFAVNNIANPLKAVRRVATHMSDTLSNDNIAKELDKAGVDLGDLTVNDIFTKKVKLTFAVNNISNPLKAVRRVATHMSDTLSDENIAKELQNAGIDLGDLTVPDVFTKHIKLQLAVSNISNPLKAVRRVATHMFDTLSNDNIAKKLKNAGVDLGDLTVPDVFTKSVKLYFAVSNISNPLKAVRRVATHMSDTLSDENILNTLKEADIDLGDLTIRDVFPKHIKLQLAVSNISNPLKAVCRVATHMSDTLSDENIAKELQNASVDLGDLTVCDVFPKKVKLTFAVHNISNPIDAVRRVATHMSETLSDKNIAKELQNAGVDLGDLTIRDVFPKHIKLQFAVNNISDPLDAVCRVAMHMTDTLSDENIKDTFKEADIDLGDLMISDIFTQGIKLRFAVNNISDPLDGVKRVATHMSETLSDKNIAKELKNAGVDLGDLTVRDVFPKYIKLHIAVKNISNPLKAVRRVATHMSDTLSNDNIAKELDEADIDLGDLTISDVFPKHIKLQLAVSNISDPLDAVHRVATHMTETLSNDNIAKELDEADIDLGDLTISDVFPKHIKLQLAVSNISDPLDAVHRVATHMTETLSNDNIAKELQNAGVDLGDLTVPDVFTKKIKLYFAVSYISDPLDGVKRVAIHMSDTLSDDNITNELQNAGINLGDLTVPDVFTKKIKLYFAVRNISDPLDACVRYIKGDVSYYGQYYKNK